jgi:uncharacterized membrane protein YgcG
MNVRPYRRTCHLALVGVIAAIVVVWIPGAGADPPSNPNNYTLSAEADALQTIVTDPSLPLTTTIAASPFGASASLNSIGQSMADAGAPYAPYIYGLVGNVNGLGAGRLPPLPNPPGYVAANYPSTPSVTQNQGPYSIEAVSSATDSRGQVRLGVAQAGSDTSTFQAVAQTTANPDGSVTVSANAGVDLLNVGGLLDIGHVSSTAKMTQQAGAAPTIASQFHMGTVTLLGQTSGLVGNALSLFGSGLPVPMTSTALPLLNAALAPAGLKLTYLPTTYAYTDGTNGTGPGPDPSKRVQSITSAAMEVSLTQNVKTQGKVTVQFIIGRVVLATSNEASGGSGSGDQSGASGGGSGPDSSGNASSGAGPASGPSGAVVGSGDTSPSAALPSSAGGSGPLAEAPALSPGAPAGSGSHPTAARRSPTATRTAAALTGLGGQGLYLVLALAAAAAVVGGNIIRLLGVKLRLFRSPQG